MAPLQDIAWAPLLSWPGSTAPVAGPFAYRAAAAAPPPPPAPPALAWWLPPTGSSHTEVTCLRAWCDAAAASAATPCCVFPAEAAPPRLCVSFAHLCTVLRIPGALLLPAAVLDPGDARLDVLRRWPDLSVAVQARDAVAVGRAALLWGARLGLAVVPSAQVTPARTAWRTAVPAACGWLLSPA